jgi:hypothetical protein
VLEVAEPNSGRDPFPTLMKRCRLPVDTSTPGGPYVSIDDLGIGKTVTVYSKELLMYAADKFTTVRQCTASLALAWTHRCRCRHPSVVGSVGVWRSCAFFPLTRKHHW